MLLRLLACLPAYFMIVCFVSSSSSSWYCLGAKGAVSHPVLGGWQLVSMFAISGSFVCPHTRVNAGQAGGIRGRTGCCVRRHPIPRGSFAKQLQQQDPSAQVSALRVHASVVNGVIGTCDTPQCMLSV